MSAVNQCLYVIRSKVSGYTKDGRAETEENWALDDVIEVQIELSWSHCVLRLIVWGWWCGIAGKAATCAAGNPYGRQF